MSRGRVGDVDADGGPLGDPDNELAPAVDEPTASKVQNLHHMLECCVLYHGTRMGWERGGGGELW